MAISQINQNSLATGVPSSIATSALPAGTIKQVVSTTKTSSFTTTSTSAIVITGLTATITPTSATSKILCIAQINVGSSSSTYNCDLYLYRNGSVTANLGDASGGELRSCSHFDPSSNRMQYSQVVNYLDNPATTSSTQYDIYIKVQSGATFNVNKTTFQDNNTGVTTSTITLFEVAA